jgi:hypothetical protein
MARPAPDPELVVRAFELATIERLSYRKISAELGVSLGTVSEWIRTAHGWYAELERASREQERNGQLAFTDWLLAEGRKQYEAGELTYAELAPIAVRILDRRAKLTGADAPARVALEDGRPPVLQPAQAKAVEALRVRIRQAEAQIVEGESA